MSIQRVSYRESPYFGGIPNGVTFTPAAKVGTTIDVLLQMLDGLKPVTRPVFVNWYLSSDPLGAVPSVASGGMASGANGWVLTGIAGKIGTAFSGATGLLDIAITQTTGVTHYLNIVMPNGTIATSGPLVF